MATPKSPLTPGMGATSATILRPNTPLPETSLFIAAANVHRLLQPWLSEQAKPLQPPQVIL
jgi:hypothetical protein